MSCYVVPKPFNVMSTTDGRPTSSTPITNATAAQRPQQRVVSVRPVTTRSDLIIALQVRSRVFVEEIGIPQNQEFDAFDGWPIQNGITHFLVVATDKYPVATCRVNTMLGNGAKLEKFAVVSNARRRGVGRALIKHLERTHLISDLSGVFSTCVLKEQQVFYDKCGWTVEHGHDPVSRGGFAHVSMVKRRPPKGAATELSLSHVMVKTIDIGRAMQFYSLLGFSAARRFITSGVRAAWIESPYLDQRIELMEVKDLVKSEDPVLQKVSSLRDYKPGMGHISLDVSRACSDLTKYLMTLQADSVSRFRMGLRVLAKPKQMMIGRFIVEVTFISDADGTILELMRIINKLERKDLDAEW